MDHSEVKHLPKVDHTPAQLSDPAKVLLRSADLLDIRGWCQGSYGRSDGSICVRSAIYRACEEAGYEIGSDRTKSIQKAFEEGGDLRSSLCWNDEPGRTQSEVIAKLRAVALGL